MYRLPQDKDKQLGKGHDPVAQKAGSLLDQFEEHPDTKAPIQDLRAKTMANAPRQSASYGHEIRERVAPQDATRATEHATPQATLAPSSPAPQGFDVKRIYDVTFTDVLCWLRRGWFWVVASIILCVFLALTIASMIPPRYTAYTDVVINPANLNVVQDGVFSPSQQRDTLVLEVESKLRMLTSRNVLEKVVSQLKLYEDPEFIAPPLSPMARLREFLKPSAPSDGTIGALRSLGERVSATRDARSFVVTLAVWSSDGDKSVDISKAIMSAFEEELFESDADGSRRAAADLTKRLEELRANVTEAEKKVEDYRSQHQLQQFNGQLASDQASSELNAQALSAQQRLIQEESRLAQMEAAIRQNRTATAAIFDSQTMNTIREQYSLLQQQIGALTLTYGSRHPRLASAGAEREMLEQAMTSEARRILEVSRAQVAEAKASKAAIDERAKSEQSRVFNNNAEMVTLRDLERDARSVAAIYETYLTRARQITEQQAIDSTNIRIISQPVPPSSRNWPPGKLTFLLAGLMLGVMIGAAIAVFFGLLRFMRRPASL